MAELLDTARRHMADSGAAALSVRAVARDLGMASSAVYRYVASRDELLTLLIVDAYESVADAAKAADAACVRSGGDAAARWLAVARGVRSWAFAHPHEYALIYGSPVPGYAAPQETVGSAVRMWEVIVGIVQAGIDAGTSRAPDRPFDVEGLVNIDVMGIYPLPEGPFTDSIVRSLALFSSMIGTVSAELFAHFRGFAHDDSRMFDLVIATAAEGVGLDLPVPRATRAQG